MQSESKLDCKRITNSSLIKFLDNQPGVRVGFATDGWIAGGFAREVFKCTQSGQTFKNYLFENNGDIDFFFKESKLQLIKKVCSVIPGVFAVNHFSGDSVRVQFVTAFTYDSIEKTFESFDFYNSCYAITRKAGEYFVVYLPKAQLLDEKKELGVRHSNSPYTLQRIAKYLSFRGLDRLSKDSDTVVYDIIVRAASESFDKKFRYNIFKPYTQKFLMQLLKMDIVKTEDLILFLGKYSVVVSESNYGLSIVEDWAASELKRDTASANQGAKN